MPGFCVNCGAPMTGAFCNKCGARAVAGSAPSQSAAQPAAQAAPPPFQPVPQSVAQPAFQPVVQPGVPPMTQPVAPSAAAPVKSSGLGKVLLIVGGVLVLLFVIGVSAAVYGVYWVKHKVSNYASAVTGGSSEPVKVVANGNSCRLLSAADLQQVLGVPIEKSAEIMEGDTPGCAYYTNQAAFAQLQKMSMELARKQADEVNSRPGPKPDSLPALLKDANQMEGIVKALGLTQAPQDGKVFAFSVDRNAGPDSWSGMRLTESTVPGFEEVPGMGDHAAIGSFGHAFYLQKGNAMIHLDTMWVPDARVRGAALGTKIIGNL